MKKQEIGLVMIGILTVLFIFSSLAFSGSSVEENAGDNEENKNELITYDKLFFVD